MDDTELEAIRERKRERLLEELETPDTPAEPIAVAGSELTGTVDEHGLVLVDLWAPWCGPCRQMEPILEAIAKRYDELLVAKINVEDNPDAADRLGVQGIPTLLLYTDGTETERLVGAQTERALDELVQAHLNEA